MTIQLSPFANRNSLESLLMRPELPGLNPLQGPLGLLGPQGPAQALDQALDLFEGLTGGFPGGAQGGCGGAGGGVPAGAVPPGLQQLLELARFASLLGGGLNPLQGGASPTGACGGLQADRATEVHNAAAVLDRHWDKVGTGKNKVADKDRLRDIVASDWAPPELKGACNTILNTPGAFEEITSAHSSGSGPFGSGISQGDLNTVQSPGNTSISNGPGSGAPGICGGGVSGVAQDGAMDTRQAADVLRRNWDKVGTGKDKVCDQNRLRDIVASDWAPPELKAAANAILNTPGAYQTLTSAHGSGDGPFGQGISSGDLNTVLSPGDLTLARNGLEGSR